MSCVVGTSSGITIHVSCVALGLGALIVATLHWFFVLKAAGAACLICLTMQTIRSRPLLKLGSESARSRNTGQTQFWPHYPTGLTTNLLNPKIILFNMMFLPQFVSNADPHATEKLIFLGLSLIPILLTVTVPLILTAEYLARTIKKQPCFMRWLDWLVTGLFTSFAVQLIGTGNQ